MTQYSTSLGEIRRNLVERFSLEELRVLCADLSVGYDDLPGETLSLKAAELLAHLDQRNQIPKLIRLLITSRPDIDWASLQTAAEDEPPFKGLQFFDVSDASLFFGREKLTAKLIDRLRSSSANPFALTDSKRFLAVVGASCSGKSSLVRAGVVASLWRGGILDDGLPALPGVTEKRTYLITPTDRPLNALSVALTRDSPLVLAATQLIDDMQADAAAISYG